MAMTALAADLFLSMEYLAEQMVQTMKVPSIPLVEIKKSLRRPTLSTKKQATTAVNRLKI
jgi:hypothetical protein